MEAIITAQLENITITMETLSIYTPMESARMQIKQLLNLLPPKRLHPTILIQEKVPPLPPHTPLKQKQMQIQQRPLFQQI